MASLYVVATPIGNLDDITIRAREILSHADRVYAEDTRISRRLITHLGLSISLLSYHDFNKERVTPRIIEEIRAGRDIALITDAGTPGIADPAYYLVRAAVRENIPVVPIPGPCAAIAALACSGLPTDRFVFENFLPPKRNRRRKRLEELADERRTVVLYESPHRIVKLLEDMNEVLGDVSVAIARELTKIHEEFLRGTPKQLLDHFSKTRPRGEMVVVFNARAKTRAQV